MQIIESGIIFQSEANRAADSPRNSLAFSSFCVLSSGRWLASCRAAPTKNGTKGQHVLLAVSDDKGGTWSTPFVPFAPPNVEGKPGLFRTACLTSLGGDEVLAALCWVDHSDSDADFFNEETQGLLDTRIFFSRSHDGGQTWSTPELMETAPFKVPTPLTGPVLLLPTGEWICQFETNKPYNDLSEWRHSSVVMFSRDQGKTWPEYSLASLVGDDRIFYWDQRPGLLPDGRILNLFWTYDNASATYLNIHASQSEDEGRTWSELLDTNIPGQPAPPVGLGDGRIAMVYVDREAAPTIKLRVSADNGLSWPEETEEVLYELQRNTQTEQKGSMQDAWSEMGKFSLGLPIAAALHNGDVLVTFYAGPHTDQTNIHWMRLRA